MLGAVWAYFLGSVFPQSAFDPLFDIAIALMGFLGGMGTLAGPIIGALLLEPTKQYFQFLPALLFPNGGKGGDAGGFYLVAYGGLFLAIMLLLPEGVVPTLSKWWSQWRASRTNTESAPDDTDASNQPAPVAMEQAGTGEEVNL
jgi:branched-chain amino acid transport system permease protein